MFHVCTTTRRKKILVCGCTFTDNGPDHIAHKDGTVVVSQLALSVLQDSCAESMFFPKKLRGKRMLAKPCFAQQECDIKSHRTILMLLQRTDVRATDLKFSMYIAGALSGMGILKDSFPRLER